MPKELVTNPIRHLRWFAGVLAGLAGALLFAATPTVLMDRARTTCLKPADGHSFPASPEQIHKTGLMLAARSVTRAR